MDGVENLFDGLRISSSGLAAERLRIDVITENIANARTTRTATGDPYRRKLVVFEPLLRKALAGRPAEPGGGLATPRVIEDFRTPFEAVQDPTHPHADASGRVEYPNVNTVVEMADLITALRSYEANLTAQENFVRMAERALELAR
ncbi:MAG: flagellar basal body rod protein FlgC [Planctomycetota bacterium]